MIAIPGGRWPADRPEDCDYIDLFWPIVDYSRPDHLLLVCPGCGLDGT